MKNSADKPLWGSPSGLQYKYATFAACIVLLISIINPFALLADLKILIYLYPACWIAWLAICVRMDSPSIRAKMWASWLILAMSVLASLLAGALLNQWSTSRKYVILQDLTVLSFFPICFPSGLIPEFLGEILELIPIFGTGFVSRVERSQGLGIFVVIVWAKYCCASFLESWLVLKLISKSRKRDGNVK